MTSARVPSRPITNGFPNFVGRCATTWGRPHEPLTLEAGTLNATLFTRVCRAVILRHRVER